MGYSIQNKAIIGLLLALMVGCATAPSPKRPPLLTTSPVPHNLRSSTAPAFGNVLHSLYMPGSTVTCSTSGASQVSEWTNTLGRPIGVVGGWLWGGASMDVAVDFGYMLSNKTSGDIYIWSNDDHYANRTGLGGNDRDFGHSPYLFLVNPGDVISMTTACAGPYKGSFALVQTMAVLEYVQ